MKYDFNIKCLLCNSISKYRYHIIIYDLDGHVIYNGYTDCRGNLNILLSEGTYKIIFVSNYFIRPIYNSIIFIVSSCNNCLNIYFKDIRYGYRRLITVNLTDAFYKGLPIMKGGIILWPNHMR